LGTRRNAAVAIVAGLVLTGTSSAVVNAAVPTFDVGNLVLFPNRDFITVEGYQGHIGETATITVTRGPNNTVIGSASHVVEEGDVAFEINHPGGACWGDGTGLKVTPDLIPGDKATISFDGEANAGDTTVQDAYATAINYTPGDTTFTVTGHIGAGVIPAQTEQRIVNPALRDTAVAKRDIRAVPGGLARAANGGYSSNLEFLTPGTFTATYAFDDAAVARIAATGGGTRFMTWQEEDADANRQGLTIAEMEELGGPGMGGCPAGPAEQSAPQPGGAFALRSSDKTQLKVNWEPAAPQPGAAAVTGYSVEAIGAATSSSGQQDTIGARVGAGAKVATLTGLNAAESYTVEVRSLTGGKMSEPFTVQAPATPPPAPGGDLTPPVTTATPTPNSDPTVAVEASSVTLTSNEPAEIYYTTDGSSVIEGDLPVDSAKLYTGPIPITALTEVHWLTIDRAGNTEVSFATYTPAPSNVPPPVAPTALVATAGQAAVTLKWTSTDTSVTSFDVRVYDASNALVGSAINTIDKVITIKPLTAGVAYTFTVTAKNAGGETVSARSAAAIPTAVTDTISIGTGKYKAGSDFRVTGSASVVGATITLYSVNSNGTIGAAIPNTVATVTAAVAPATGGVWEVRLRNGNVPAQNPVRIFAKSSGGGIAGPFTLS
jgi:hypothetical protein